MKTAKQNAGAELLRAALAHSDVYNSGDYDGLAGCLARAELELAVDHYRDAKSEPAVNVALSVNTSKALAQLDEVLWRLHEIQRIADAFAVPVQMLAGPIRLPGGRHNGYYYVKVSEQLVDELTSHPSEPVVIAEITELASSEFGTELELVMRTHACEPSKLAVRTPHETFVLAAATAWYHAYNAFADGTETRRAKELASSVGRMLDA